MTMPPAAEGAAPEASPAIGAGPVLVVDLDGTLCRTDTLHEAVLGIARRAPLKLFALPRWIALGRARFKERIADIHVVPGTALPLNPAVLDEVRAARAAGRRVALVSAADRRQVEAAIATGPAAGLFDEVHGTEAGQNLKGPAKARFLVDRYGAGGFDYIGDHRADLPVWAAARTALTVRADPRLCRAAEEVSDQTRHLDTPQPRAKARAMLRALRPHQWLKNLLLFFPALSAQNAPALWEALWGFVAFCCVASAVYVINDLLDLADDRAHPRKRRRPFAAGELPALTGIAMAGGLFAAGFGQALFLALSLGHPAFLATLAIYVVMTFLYSLWLKRKVLIDVVTLAGLYTVRLVAGGAVAGVMLSPWLLGFSMFVFLSLAAVKRQAELVDQQATGRQRSGRAYVIEDLPVLRSLAISTGTAAVLVLALYIASDDVQRLYDRPGLLWGVCPLVMYWMLHMVLETHRGHMTDDPIVFAATDRTSLVIIASCAVLVVAAAF